jgi:hypothetical protein
MSCVHHVGVAPPQAGVFDAVCDACFVILCCEGSGWRREPSIRATLRELRPCARTELYFFRGRSQCAAERDLALNLLHVFQVARSRGYRRVLVLEDDAEVHPAFRPRHAADIAAFVRATDPEVYGLGNHATPTPLTVWAKHQKAAFSRLLFTQAVLYSAAYMAAALQRQAELLSRAPHCDQWPRYLRATAYRFHLPVVVQTFPRTENRDRWALRPGQSALGRAVDGLVVEAALAFFRATKLETRVEPGWRLMYALDSAPAYLLCAACMLSVLYALTVVTAA